MLRHNEDKAVVIYFISYIVLIATQIVLSISSNIDFTIEDNIVRLNSIMNLGFYGILAMLFVVFFIQFWKGAFAQFKQNRNLYFKYVAIGFAALIGVSLLMNLIYTLLGITDTSANQAQLDQLLNGAFFDKFSLIMFAVFLAPMVEEMVFRMAVFNFLLRFKKMKPWIMIVISSFIFGFIHVMGAWDLEQIFYYAGLGAVLGFFYYKSKNIVVPIIIHMLLNGFVTLSMFFL